VRFYRQNAFQGSINFTVSHFYYLHLGGPTSIIVLCVCMVAVCQPLLNYCLIWSDLIWSLCCRCFTYCSSDCDFVQRPWSDSVLFTTLYILTVFTLHYLRMQKHLLRVWFARWRRARDSYDKKLLEESEMVDTVDSRQRRHLATGLDNATTRTTTSSVTDNKQYISSVSGVGHAASHGWRTLNHLTQHLYSAITVYLTANAMLGRSLFITQKAGFWPSYCQISTDLNKILHTPIAVRNTLVRRLRPRSARGRLRAKPERLCFSNTCNLMVMMMMVVVVVVVVEVMVVMMVVVVVVVVMVMVVVVMVMIMVVVMMMMVVVLVVLVVVMVVVVLVVVWWWWWWWWWWYCCSQRSGLRAVEADDLQMDTRVSEGQLSGQRQRSRHAASRTEQYSVDDLPRVTHLNDAEVLYIGWCKSLAWWLAGCTCDPCN